MSKVATDAEAFAQIRHRLEGDVGGVIKLVDTKQLHVPFWALVRMLFPVAEATADLIHHHAASGTADALVRLLATEFETQRAGYKKVAATLTLLYRHSLTHTDEMRLLRSGGRDVVWQLTYGSRNHLRVTKNTATNFTVEFDCKSFYEDLVKTLKAAETAVWNGQVMARYNWWFELDLDAKALAGLNLNKTEKAAVQEIAAL